ncbi:glycosyltransferase family 4 protein [Chryseobacterium hagamense]|uniref:Glycosyltransferase WbuB n=1 Tax=Chryseobacterium hagamense TaxID=395935 RepID=A0A511YLT7_9FLAO|nr:glycosyltransferase family 4 protein [Chryseobacterium hagamense]GEN76162.1 glycosyltransferase WbuB [Chryseobacterium hagamense]
MKNILIISAVFPPEPVVSASLSYDIANNLADYNNVTVISPFPTRPKDFNFSESNTSNEKFKHIVANSFTCPDSDIIGRMKESYSFGQFCAGYVTNNYKKIDVIYQNSWPIFSQYLIYKAAKKYKLPLLTHVMDIYPESLVEKLPFAKSFLVKMLMPIDRKVLSYSDKIICISENMKIHLAKTRQIIKDKLVIINNWQDEEQFINFRNQVSDVVRTKLPFTFMYLGNNGPVAGVEFLIQSFVKAGIENSKLIIAGSGSRTDACKELVKQLNAQNIDFIPVPSGKVPEIQYLADIMLLPVKKNAAYSSIPSKLPAYMLSEKPIIGSLDLDSDTANAILEADAGWVVEPENSEQLINVMQKVSQYDINILKSKGRNALNYSLKHFSKKENLKKITQLIVNSEENEN